MQPFKNKRILLGVTGSIACYKSADLASKLRQGGAEVDVILTNAATNFVSPLTFQSVTGRKAYTEKDLWGDQGHILHIGLAKEADLILVAPATANTLAKIAHGEAGNLLTLAILAATCPVMVAPAMDGGMLTNAATKSNMATLEERGIVIVGPEEGHLASGLSALGRMSEPEKLYSAARYQLGKTNPLKGELIIVTAGGTREMLDPVRYLTNKSSGKQGYAIAQAAIDFGAEVRLISSAKDLPIPYGAEYIAVESAAEMKEKVIENIDDSTALIMAAAVADFRPEEISTEKIKKEAGRLNLSMVGTDDILNHVAKEKEKIGFPKITIGFAAESENVKANAKGKLTSKNLDLIVANDISASDAGFQSDGNRVSIIDSDMTETSYPLMDKYLVGVLLMEEILKRLEN